MTELGKAAFLSSGDVEVLAGAICRTSRDLVQDCLVVQLSFHGLRVGEIARLEVRHILNVYGEIGRWIWISPNISKRRRERYVVISEHLRRTLKIHLTATGIKKGRVVRYRGRPVQPNALGQRFARLYRKAGLLKARSHFGRRTFVTLLTRNAWRFDCTMEDIMPCIGHTDVETTMEYMEPSTQQRDLIGGEIG